MPELTSSVALFVGLVALVGAVRVVELVVARRNLLWAMRRGGVEHGAGHYPVMVALHTTWFVACIAEVVLLDRPFVAALGWPMLALLVAAHALRWWCIAALGHRWNTRVVVVPGLPLVARGPYRFLRHPNYVAVVVELAVLPLVHGAWLTAVTVTVLNAALLAWRIRVEEEALAAGVAAAPAPNGPAAPPQAPPGPALAGPAPPAPPRPRQRGGAPVADPRRGPRPPGP